MKVGSLVYASVQGLGVLAREFVRNGIVTHPLIIEHAHHQTHFEWYPGAPSVKIRKMSQPREKSILREFCRSVDLMLFFETPFDWDLVSFCRQHGVKTVLMPMYECEPTVIPVEPDLYICPSLLDLSYYCGSYTEGDIIGIEEDNFFRDHRNRRSMYLPVPVDVPWRLRTKATTFVHTAGHGGLLNRNGTGELIDAMHYTKSPLKLLLRSQKTKLAWDVTDPRIELFHGTIQHEDLWKDGGFGDVFVFPEKFNGLSLPLQEARAAGMLVIATDRFPMNTWLPKEGLVPSTGYKVSQISGRCNFFKEATIDPVQLGAMLDQWYDKDISEISLSGKAWAESMSWARLGPRYLKVLQRLVS